ncbi:MAG: hypothetical protein ACTHPD_08730 [Rhizomicrobium sp.]
MRRLIALALPLLFLVGPADASWKFPTRVRYEVGSGFTPWANANVLFVTGNELNRVATNTQLRPAEARFAVIPMTDGELNIVRLSGFVACGSAFTADCIPGGRADGFDGKGRHWQLCTHAKCD